jgi:hypothetical protein
MSDERNETYLRSVFELIENLFPHVQVLSADALVWQHVKEYIAQGKGSPRFANNYYTFQILTLLQWTKAEFAISQRRTFACPYCSRVIDYMGIPVGDRNSEMMQREHPRMRASTN